MAELHFEAQPMVRILTAIVAYANGVALLASVVLAAIGRPAGLVLLPLWLWGAIEVGRAAWSNMAKVTVTADAIRIERSNSTDIIDVADISWFGLTRRGVVVETATDRFGVFDQDWQTATALANELDTSVTCGRTHHSPRAQPLTVSYDALRQQTNLGLLFITFLGTGIIAVAAALGELSVLERVLSLGTAVPISVSTLVYAVQLARRPVSATFRQDNQTVSLRRLYGSSIALTPDSVIVSPSRTLTQWLTGANPGEAIVVRSSNLRWSGPIAAPGSFDHLLESRNR